MDGPEAIAQIGHSVVPTATSCRLVYRMPNTVHGTDDLNSLGKASSHRSIRVANEVALQLAEMLLKAGNSWEGPQWFQQMAGNRTEEYQVPLEQRIPIKVQD